MIQPNLKSRLTYFLSLGRGQGEGKGNSRQTKRLQTEAEVKGAFNRT
jgi:hypothetical protein